MAERGFRPLPSCLYVFRYRQYIYRNNKHRKPRRFQAKFWCYLTYIRVVAATKHNRSCYVASVNTVMVNWTVYTMYDMHTVESIRGLISTISVLDTWGCLSSLDAWETNTRYKWNDLKETGYVRFLGIVFATLLRVVPSSTNRPFLESPT
jgi:hypothetical protein